MNGQRVRRFSERTRELSRAHPLGTVVIIFQTIAAFGCLAYAFGKQGQGIPFVGSGRFELQAEFADASGLNEAKQPQVLVAGIPSGIVSKTRYENGRALVTFELDEKARGKIHADATAQVVPRSPLNILEVDIDPGSPDAPGLREGARIPQKQTSGSTSMDRLTEVLDSDTRAYVQILLDQLAVGLRGRSPQLRAAIARLQPALDSTRRVSAALADRRTMLKRLVGDLQVVFRTLGERGDDLRGLVTAGERTLGTVGRRQSETARTVAELGPALANVNAAMDGITALARPLNPALERFRAVARPLPAAMRKLRAFVPDGLRLVRVLDALARNGRQPLTALRGTLGELGRASRALLPAVQRLEPVLTAIDKHGNGIGELGSNFAGVFSGQDAASPTLRALGFFEAPRPENFGGGSPAEIRRDLATALRLTCDKQKRNVLACLAQDLIPGLTRKPAR